MSEENAIVTTTGGNFLAPVATVEDVLMAYQTRKDIVEKVLRRGVDYGTIPGGTKDALFKPGAEKFSNMYGLTPVFEDVQIVEDWTGADHDGEPFFYYRQKCKLYKGDALMGTADGSCNSWEKKYRYRKQERICPTCSAPAVIKGKTEYGGGWLCWQKKDGCGAKFKDGDQAIESQDTGYIPNPDVAEQVNTILKMAQKRALVAAVLIVTGASDYFTQDIEDFIEGTFTASVQPEQEPSKSDGNKFSLPAAGTHDFPGDRQQNAADGNGWNPVQILIDAKVSKDNFSASGIVNTYAPKNIVAAKDTDALIAWGKLYRGWRDSGLTAPVAAEKATAGEQPK